MFGNCLTLFKENCQTLKHDNKIESDGIPQSDQKSSVRRFVRCFTAFGASLRSFLHPIGCIDTVDGRKYKYNFPLSMIIV